MERARLLQNGATTEESGALLVAGDYSPHAFSQGDGAAIQTDSSKIRPHAHALQEHRPARFGLPCANCKAYYDCELHACPICKCAERVPAVEAEAESKKGLKKPSAGVLQGVLGSFIHLGSTPACKPPMQLALPCDDDGERFLWESKILLCAHIDEIDAGPDSAGAPGRFAGNRRDQIHHHRQVHLSRHGHTNPQRRHGHPGSKQLRARF